MSDDRFFPDVDEWAVRILLENLRADPNYLDHEDCPYSDEFRTLFRGGAVEMGEIEDLDLEAESLRLFTELREAKDSMGGDDHAERMAYFRTSTSLLDKLITMRERAQNVKAISRFYRVVLDLIEEMLEPGQITRFRERLKEEANVDA